MLKGNNKYRLSTYPLVVFLPLAILCLSFGILSHQVGAVLKPGTGDNSTVGSDSIVATEWVTERNNIQNAEGANQGANNTTDSDTPSSPAAASDADKSSARALSDSSHNEQVPATQSSVDWTPWLLGGGAVLVLALAGVLVWRTKKK